MTESCLMSQNLSHNQQRKWNQMFSFKLWIVLLKKKNQVSMYPIWFNLVSLDRILRPLTFSEWNIVLYWFNRSTQSFTQILSICFFILTVHFLKCYFCCGFSDFHPKHIMSWKNTGAGDSILLVLPLNEKIWAFGKFKKLTLWTSVSSDI